MLRRIAFFILSLFSCACAVAQNFSYVYIQGDKQTPFYVKMEDEMLPRFGKNYSLISELAPGPVKLEILFQQNAYPPQRFVVRVPENGFRGFLLTQKNGGFSLYDIQQQFYLPAGNKAEDDHLPEVVQQQPEEPANTPVANPPATEKKEPVIAKAAPVRTPKPPKPVPVPKSKIKAHAAKPAASEPVFLNNVELGKESANTVPAGGVVKNKLAITNSDCPKAISNDDFDVIYKKTMDKPPTAKLKYLLDKLDNCYTTNQIRQLTLILSGDDQRFTFLKRAYARVTDQSYFSTLENLLFGPEWKEYFRNMLQH